MKKRLKNFLSIPLRAWRSRGFGVHSPFAFRFITEVLRCPHGYYAYPAIGSSAAARRLYRIILALAPEKVIVTGPLSDSLAVAVSLAKTEVQAVPRRDKLAVVPPEAIVGISYLRSILAAGGAVVFTNIQNAGCAEIFAEIAPCGMTFAGLRQAVVVGGNLPPQQFPVLI